ncbi:MAG: DNA polymerase III subunit [Candidatus Omnitrophica bacterium]|nr:DNA polymerase III subunit [Candidatus Omnitrophota bacterium]
MTNLAGTEIIERFTELRAKGKLAHAYLFIGPQGSGKLEVALSIASSFNCEQVSSVKNGCGRCSSCLNILSHSHPNVILVEKEEEKTQITIEQIRQAVDVLRLAALIGKIKVCIIKNAELLGLDAGSALLKTLEEPPGNTLFMLTTSQPQRILPTVQSRAQAVYFKPLSFSRMNKFLKEELSLSSEQAHYISYLSQGYEKRAVEMKEAGVFDRKNEFIDSFILSDSYDSRIKDLTDGKEDERLLISTLQAWLRDAILFKAGVEDSRIINNDRKKELGAFVLRFSFSELTEAYDETLKAMQAFYDNLNFRVALMLAKAKINK